jgi:hypothetical protein
MLMRTVVAPKSLRSLVAGARYIRKKRAILGDFVFAACERASRPVDAVC